MRRLKIVLIAGLLALCLISSQAIADVNVSLKLHRGWTNISAGNVNPGTQAYFAWLATFWPASQREYLAVHEGYEIGLNIIFELSRTVGIGIGWGYLRAFEDSSMSVWIPDTGVHGGLTVEPTLTAIPIRLGLFLNLPLTKRVYFTANIGASYYFRARYRDEWYFASSTAGTITGYMTITTLAEKKGIPLGVQGGLGIEYRLFRRIFLCLDVHGRRARFRGLQGSSELLSDYFDPFYEQGTLYYESVPMLPDAPRLIMVQSDPPPGPDGEPRLAVVDFSGVSLQAGIRIRL